MKRVFTIDVFFNSVKFLGKGRERIIFKRILDSDFGLNAQKECIDFPSEFIKKMAELLNFICAFWCIFMIGVMILSTFLKGFFEINKRPFDGIFAYSVKNLSCEDACKQTKKKEL